MSRGVWIAACVIGVIVLGGLSVFLGYAVFLAVDEGAALSLRSLTLPATLILAAGACAAALFMTPREVQEATKIEVDEEPAQWIEDMRTSDREKGE